MTSHEKAKEAPKEEIRPEEIVEDLWRDLYETRCKLAYGRKTLPIDEVLFVQKG